MSTPAADDNQLRAAIAAVRELHQPVTDRTGWLSDGTYDSFKSACSTCGAPDNAVAYPCPTIRALDGTEQKEQLRQLGVGVKTQGGETEFHPCATREEAWALYRILKDTRPGALVWVGKQDQEQSQ